MKKLWLFLSLSIYFVGPTFALSPLDPVPTTNLSSGSASPAAARVDLLEAVSRQNFDKKVRLSQFANLSTAKATIGSTPKTLILDTTSTVNNLTIPATLKLEHETGGLITINSGKTLTFLSQPNLPVNRQVFAGAGGVTDLKEARPEMFGINTNPGITDMGAAIIKALDAAPVVKMQVGIYATSVEIPIINGRKLIGAGVTWWQDTADMPTGAGETIIKYIGAGGANSAVIRASTASVGTKPTYPTGNNFGVVVRNIVIDGNNLAEYGLYSARSGLGSTYSNIIATGTKKHGVWLGEMWTCAVRDVRSIWNYGAGVSIGVDTFSWAGGNVVNAVEFDNIQAYQNGRDLGAWTTADYLSGYGINFSGTRSNTLKNIVAEENLGVGIVWAPTSGPNILESWYSEDNCKIAASSSDRWAFWFQSGSGSVLSVIRNGKVLYNGASGLTDAPRIRLTGTGITNPSEIPVFDGVLGGAVFDSDYGTYRIDRTALLATTRIVSHYPQYGETDSISNASQVVLYVGDTATGTGSGIDASNRMGSIAAALRVARILSSIETINIAAVALATDWTLDFSDLHRGLVIEGGGTASITQSATGTNALYIKSALFRTTFQNIPTLGRVKVDNSHIRFSTCPFTITGNTTAAGLILSGSDVELNASPMNLASKTGGYRGYDVNNRSTLTAMTSSVSNFDTALAALIRTGGGQLFTDQSLSSSNITWESGQGAVYTPTAILLSGATK